MNLADFFGFKPTKGADSENALDDLLKKAANDPAFRPQFYKKLLECDLYILGRMVGDYKNEKDGTNTAGNNTRLQIAMIEINGRKQAVLYSSLAIMRDSLKEQADYVKMNGKMIFELLPEGTWAILNPGAPHGKQLSSDEIRQIRDGSLFRAAEGHVIPKEQEILLGQPTRYPEKLMTALISYFETGKDVDRAYIVQADIPGSGEPPHCVIGVELSKDTKRKLEEILSEVGIVTRDTLLQGEFVDFTDMSIKGTVTEYMMNQTKPFFVR